MVNCMDTWPAQDRTLLEDRLSASAQDLLRRIGALLATDGVPAWVVGGAVRDALLGLPFDGDLDITVEGDGVAAAQKLAAAIEGEVIARSRFGTATVRVGGLHVDVVTARAEHYPIPGALPVVQPATLAQDLARRDFTVNAMAVSISPGSWGALHDPQGGRADLQAGLIRVLHDRSFRDDPTRVVRALRYATRLGFHLSGDTAEGLRQALPGVAALSAARRWHELEHCLREPAPDAVLTALHQASVLAQLHPDLVMTEATTGRWDRWRRHRYEARLVPEAWLALLCWDASTDALERIIDGLGLPGSYQDTLRTVPTLREAESAELRVGLTPARLQNLPLATLQAGRYALAAPEARAAVRTHLALWRFVGPFLRGDDLLALGVPRGPEVGRYLAALRLSRLQELTKTVDDERWLVQGWLAGSGPPPA